MPVPVLLLLPWGGHAGGEAGATRRVHPAQEHNLECGKQPEVQRPQLHPLGAVQPVQTVLQFLPACHQPVTIDPHPQSWYLLPLTVGFLFTYLSPLIMVMLLTLGK